MNITVILIMLGLVYLFIARPMAEEKKLRDRRDRKYLTDIECTCKYKNQCNPIRQHTRINNNVIKETCCFYQYFKESEG